MGRRSSRITSTTLAVLVIVGLSAARVQAQLTTPDDVPVSAAPHTSNVTPATRPAKAGANAGNPALAQQLSELQRKIARIESAFAKSSPRRSAATAATAGTMPGMTAPAAPTSAEGLKGDSALAQQLSELWVRVAQLETAAANGAPYPAAAEPPAGTMPGMPAPATSMPGMSGATPRGMKPPGGMMGMMEKMMGMMEKMMPMGAGDMPAGAPVPGAAAVPHEAPPAVMSGGGGMMENMMGMMEKMMSMGGAVPAGAPVPGGAQMPPEAPPVVMSGGGGMPMEKMEKTPMMDMDAMGGGGTGAMPQSVLPGLPGASHLYHIGATGFFLDHPQYIALSTEQQTALARAKEQASLAKSTSRRAIQQAEQELWMLTAADQPSVREIEVKIREIGKLTAEERFAFIRAVGNASNLLTDQQRETLTGFAAPASAAAMPAPAMNDM